MNFRTDGPKVGEYNDFLTFADFVFDGFLADVLVQSKISEAKRQCDDAIRQVTAIRRELTDKLRG